VPGDDHWKGLGEQIDLAVLVDGDAHRESVSRAVRGKTIGQPQRLLARRHRWFTMRWTVASRSIFADDRCVQPFKDGRNEIVRGGPAQKPSNRKVCAEFPFDLIFELKRGQRVEPERGERAIKFNRIRGHLEHR
jgi:hypothetical protein